VLSSSLAKETVKEMRVNLDRFLSEYEGDADFVSAWIALDDVDTDNGCLRVIPGSHKQRKLLRELHFDWARQHHSRITKSAEGVDRMLECKEPPGILIGYADKEELEPCGRPLPGHVDS